MNDIEPEQLIKSNIKKEKRWDLPNVLKFYQNQDFAIQQKAKFIYFLSISIAVCILFLISTSSYIQLTSPLFNGLYWQVLLPEIGLFILFLLCLFFLIKGYYKFSGHLLIISALFCVWFIMWTEKGEIITKFDTIVLIVALLNIMPLIVNRFKLTFQIYISVNVIILLCFTWYVGQKMGLTFHSMFDYFIDSSIAIIFTGIFGYRIFKINKKTLDRAILEINERKQTEKELEQSRDQFQSLVSNIPGITYRCKYDKNWTMLFISNEINRLSGYTSTEFINNQIRSYESIILSSDKEKVSVIVQESIKNRTPWEIEYRIKHKDGNFRWVYERGRAIFDNLDQVEFLDGFILDIHDRKTAETALIESEIKYRTLFENAQIGIYQTTPDGKILSANPSLIQMLGFDSFEELERRNLETDEAYIDSPRKIFKEMMETQGIVKNFESKWKKKDGETVIIIENSRAEKDSDGKIIYYEGFVENITDRKKAEKALKESQQLFETLTQMSPVGIFRTKANGYTTFVNPKWSELSGMQYNEALGDGWLNAVHPDDRISLAENWKLHASKGEISKAQYRFLKPEGKVTWVLGETIPEIIDNKIKGYIGTITDITSRVKIEETIKQSEEIFRSLIELAPNSITVADLKGRYMIANKNFTKYSGYSFDEIIGKSYHEIGLGFDQATEAKINEELLNNGIVENIEASFVDKSGNRLDVYYSGKIIQMQNMPVILSSTIDVTEKKKTERELEKYRNGLELLVNAQTEELVQNIEELMATQESIEKKNEELNLLHLELLEEKKLIDALMDNIPDAIYFKDLQSRFIKISKSLHINFNRIKNSEIIGQTDFDFYTDEHAIPAYNDEQEIIKTRKPIVDLIEKETWKDGTISYSSTTKMPMEDINGNIIGTFGISRDITKLIEMEAAIKQQNEELLTQREQLETALENLQNAQNQLIHAEKMASLGVLAAGVAHEINNPLNFINGGIIGLESYFKENLKDHLDQVYPLIKGIQVGVSRAAEIVTSLNHYSRRNEIPNLKCDIHSIIDNCLVMLQNQTKNRIKIIKNYCQEKHHFKCNESKLHQAILNIISNAEQAIEVIGTITISTTVEKNYLKIAISDDGCGIPSNNLSKIIDPFFTTKEPGKGTGLGLSITYNIIKEHNGTLDIDSTEGVGTVVLIKLPLNSN